MRQLLDERFGTVETLLAERYERTNNGRTIRERDVVEAQVHLPALRDRGGPRRGVLPGLPVNGPRVQQAAP